MANGLQGKPPHESAACPNRDAHEAPFPGRGVDLRARYFFYDLFLSMTVSEPTDEAVAAWRRGLEAVRIAEPESAFGRSAEQLVRLLDAEDAGARVRSEFNRIFCDPVGRTVSLLASSYVDGRPFGRYLVRLRTFLEDTPFEKEEGYAETEDSLPFHLDLMRCFIREELAASSPAERKKWQGFQKEFLLAYLAAWIPDCIAELTQREAEPFYREAAALMAVFFREEQAACG
ncbi:MAG: hypothetical protein A3K19_25200 [Lentisphaerae bacterium RIFOXYB12_FULL_65_16]|nr:MAG: hypothetical protein A3K18_06675 [Lentisphaerae bacterium RIFOXYA12_64_32]OGV91119.1 MAG: hypothetical protein A3K19_25200 [Lentisphaerae bacterium RIFOXYB12_FULL_65_16]